MSAAAKPTAMDPHLTSLKTALENMKEGVFEKLSAHLMSRFLDDIAITVAKSGHQVGADAGTAGARGRRLRIECKRYKETTGLSARELAGEVSEAIGADPLLEVWILMATKAVRENERRLAFNEGQRNGIAVFVFDWTQPPSGAGICALAALCATWPEVVEQHVGKAAATAASALAAFVGPTIDIMRRDLEIWNIGYKRLREASHAHLKSMWTDPGESQAHFGQNAAGGSASVQLIARKRPLAEMTTWWTADPAQIAPAVVTGPEGVGKTWAALDWTLANLEKLPIALVLPSSAFASEYDVSIAGIQDLLAKALKQNFRSTLSDEYWRTRITRLLARPEAEGPSFFLVVDGLNQHPRTKWLALAQSLQATELRGRVRLLLTCRESYYNQYLKSFSQLEYKPARVPVQVYDGAEFDEILCLHGMNRNDLHKALHHLARVPRLFPLVYRLKDNEALKSDATVSRLLFEYGRDVVEQREGSVFAEGEWVQWLTDKAKRRRDQLAQTGKLTTPESLKALENDLQSASLGPEDVQRRMSEIVDGHFQEAKQIGVGAPHVQLRTELVVLGLALAMLETLDHSDDDYDARQAALEEWVEPIAAIDLTASVLRAALVVLSAGATVGGKTTPDCLLVTWMHSQNPGDDLERDAALFGDAMPLAMLTVIERSSSHAREVARSLAIASLRGLSRARPEWHAITERLTGWAGWLNVPHPKDISQPGHYAKRHHEQIAERIGRAEPCRITVLGAHLWLDVEHPGDPGSAIPGILEGHDLTQFRDVFRTAAVREAAQVGGLGRVWQGLGWLAMVASADEGATKAFLINLADEILAAQAEPDVQPRLANRAAALLLRLVGDEDMETRAAGLDDTFGTKSSYAEYYAKSPAHSHFTPEHRHIATILAADDVAMWRRLEKIDVYLPDPTIQFSDDVQAELATSLDQQSFQNLGRSRMPTIDDVAWEKRQPIAARILPEKLFDASHRQLHELVQRVGSEKYWSSAKLDELMLVIAREDAPKIGTLRTSTKLQQYEEMANTLCLQLEILHMPVEEQLKHLLQAGEYASTPSLFEVIRLASAGQLEAFLRENPTAAAELLVLEVMAQQETEDASDLARKLLHVLDSPEERTRNVAFMALSLCAPEICGQHLLSNNWKFNAADAFAAHFGSDAVASASLSLALEDVQPLIAPWRWLEAVATRGNDSSELRTVSKALVSLLRNAVDDLPGLPGEFSMLTPKKHGLATIRIGESRDPQETPEEALFRSMSDKAEEADRRLRELSRAAADSIRNIRGSGQSFYLQAFSVSSLRAAYSIAPDEWNKLLEGAEENTPEFVKRVQAAEGLYMALCELLLGVDPDKGAILWHGLLGAMRTKFRGPADIPDFVHMLFRVPDSPAVNALREALASFAATSTDRAILDLIIVSQLNGRDDWLAKLVDEDKRAAHQWRRKRGVMLEALRSYPKVDALDWPMGEIVTSKDSLESRMAKWRNRGALARWWWRQFLEAKDVSSAFAAWTVFLSCADRRAYVWMKEEAQQRYKDSELDRLRSLHVGLNWQQLEKSLVAWEKKGPDLSNHLFGYEAPAHWLRMDAIPS
ncbi:hypothetical protein PO002_08395 [Cupriavidus necator]|uniref:hypothetical protein n=1 Tax=Cupriavidus necator TaxID=106590 RepID=UPI0039C2DCB3